MRKRFYTIFPYLSVVVITYFVSGVGTSTLPVYIYSMIRHGISPEINAIGTIFVVGSLFLVLLAGLEGRGTGRTPA